MKSTSGTNDKFNQVSIDGSSSHEPRSVYTGTSVQFLCSNNEFDYLSYTAGYSLHKTVTNNSFTGAALLDPVYYVRFGQDAAQESHNSSANSIAAVEQDFDKIERRLRLLGNPTDKNTVIEAGAVSSALYVLTQIKESQIAPPHVSWHGGDAVVMLWSIGNSTCAITVTDGEVGYIIRRDRKAIRIEDSIKLESFILSQVRQVGSDLDQVR